ncbi:MAG: hypothetical protein AAF449_06755 [Myxococcota bacterium]
MSLALGIALTALVTTARPPDYGGEIISYVYGPSVTDDPATTRTAADAAAHSAVFETLYARRGDAWVPVLADGLPRVELARIVVPLRTDVVRHDGAIMTPAHVAEAFVRLERIPRAAYVLKPVRRLEEGRPAVYALEDEPAVAFEFADPDPYFIHLLAADHARLAWPSTSGPMVGTGPFRWYSATEQRPFVRHRDGRPFIGSVVWRPYASRFGATALAERGQAPIFGGPKPPRVFVGAGSWLILQIGSTIGDASLRERLRKHMQAALRRSRITRRYMGPDERANSGFIDTPLSETKVSVRGLRQLQLRAPRGLRFGHRLVERVQLDLFRSGLQVQTRWVDRDAPSNASEDLRLFELRPGIIDDGTPRAQMHRLLSAAAALGALDRIEPALLKQFGEEDNPEVQQRTLQELDLLIRRVTGTVVVARTAPAVALPAAMTVDAAGLIDWANLQGAP